MAANAAITLYSNGTSGVDGGGGVVPSFVTMPTPNSQETYSDYVTRLRHEGWLGTATVVTPDGFLSTGAEAALLASGLPAGGLALLVAGGFATYAEWAEWYLTYVADGWLASSSELVSQTTGPWGWVDLGDGLGDIPRT